MAGNTISDEFPNLPFWATTSNLELVSDEDISFPTSDLSSTSSCFYSHPSSISDASPIQDGYIGQSCKIRAQGESQFDYQLPSPIEEEVKIDPDVVDKERRREQNRVAQRAFRERKESKMKQLEKRILELKADYRSLEKKYNNLRTAHLRMESGLRILLDASGTYDGQEIDSNSVSGDSRAS